MSSTTDDLKRDITECYEELRLARDYSEPEAELDACNRMDALLDLLPRPAITVKETR